MNHPRKRLTILGLNSGTSIDSIDMAVLSFQLRGNEIVSKWLAGGCRKLNDRLRYELLRLADSSSITLEDLIRTDNSFGIFLGRTADRFINTLKNKNIKVHAIASHGQTVRHLPQVERVAGYDVRGTLQIGSLEQISSLTGVPVVGDFRQAAVALGGEGAPITVDAVRQLLEDRRESRLIVNIGGMSNYFYLPATGASGRVKAADCGPGNILSDLFASSLFNEPYDRNGRHASRGTVDAQLLRKISEHTGSTRRSVSTGRERFGPNLIDRIAAIASRRKIFSDDIMATVAEFTVEAIVRAVSSLLRADRTLTKLYLTGGGSHNKFFVQRLRERLEGTAVGNVRELGYDPDLLEAASYALIGFRTLHGMATPDWTRRSEGTDRQPVMGKIVQPPRKVC